MKNLKTQFLVAGLLAGTLTFAGCKSNESAERTMEPTDTTQTTPAEGTGTGTGTGTEGTTTGSPESPPGTGGAGPSGTKQSEDNPRMPEEDPLRTPESEGVRDAEREPGVHDSGTGGAGVEEEPLDPATGGSGTIDEGLNEGGNINDDFRSPESPSDTVTPDDPMQEDSLPEGNR